MSILCNGMEYFDFNTRIGPTDTRLFVARVTPSSLPFIISSITNNPLREDAGYPFLNRRRAVLTVREKDAAFLSRETRVNAGYQNQLYTLRPVWVSNGTFFGPHQDIPAHIPSRIFGPIVHNHTALADPPLAFVPEVAKRRRWYFRQLRTEPYRTFFERNTTAQTATQLVDDNFGVIGGAGSLISAGQVKTQADWRSPDEGVFGEGQYYSCGPIIAQTGGERPIHYLILPGSHVRWEHMAPYLRNGFGTEVSNAANREVANRNRVGRRGPDPNIRDALVYDGGGSKQLWIHNQRPRVPLRPRRAVPHYICLWGRV